MTQQTSEPVQLTLTPDHSDWLSNLCGDMNEHIKLIEKHLNVTIFHQGNHFQIHGTSQAINAAKTFLINLYKGIAQAPDHRLSAEQIHTDLQQTQQVGTEQRQKAYYQTNYHLQLKKYRLKPKNLNQEQYLRRLADFDINFGIGPAGTGKTYLAIAAAVNAFQQGRVKKLVLVRPAVEAGESLGFLPGDMAQKVDPYLRPMYDALHELMGAEQVQKLVESQLIEIAPLAYMRGRTINDAFVVLDEAQNTTIEQMKMFLTRIGFNTSAVATGDISQIDLPPRVTSGLRHAINILADIDGIAITYFEGQDIVRHPLVQKIVNAYESTDQTSHQKSNRSHQ